MIKKVFLIPFCLTFLLASCKKDEVIHDCPEPLIPYSSVMLGEKFNEVRFTLTYMPSGGENWCEGWFIHEVYQNGMDKTISLDFKIQVVEGIPEWVRNGNYYFGKEFFIDVEFIGIGYECLYYEELDDNPWNPYLRDIELVKNTKIVEVI
ncbi:MAG: hypothetical protein ACJA2N_001046 [Salibacteraceae bacterium]|jgi:hypothetical protein